MVNNFFKIKNAVVSDSEILSLFHQFWTAAPVTNTSSVYALCILVIGMCMYAAGCRNLIYKVLNLAVLSVFVVSLWAYLTDVTFIYVVYILTFVSAVVMLFLSVVLMLPSSAISISTKNSNVLLLAVVGFSSVNTVVVLGAVVISIVLAYLVYAFYRTRAYNHTYEIYGEPKQPAKLEYTEVPVSEQIKTLESLYILKNFSSDDLNKKAADSCLSYNIYGEKLSSTDYTTGDNFARVYGDRDLTKYIRGVKGSSYPAYVRVYPKYFFKSRRSLQDYKVVNLLLTVFYEFTDFYFRVLEPGVLNESKIYSAATRGLKKFVNLGVTNPPLPSLWYDENGWRTQCRFNTESKGLVIFVLNRPWWSPFQVFRGPNNLPIFISTAERIIEKLKHWAEVIKGGSFFKLDTKIVVNLLAYIVNFFDSARNHLAGLTFKINSSYVELLVQISSTLSIFLLAAPSGYPGVAKNNYSSHVVGEIFSESLENLAAIQHQLYVVSPLLMIVSVTGLLVALIGAPLFVSPGHATKKVAHKH